MQREYQDKIKKNERIKNYSKNVKEMYMPEAKERNKSSNAERKFIEMGMSGGGAQGQYNISSEPTEDYGTE